MHAAGETAVARSAGRAGIPYALSTLGTTAIERLAAEAPDVDRWFQLYVSKGTAVTSASSSSARANLAFARSSSRSTSRSLERGIGTPTTA